MTTFFDGRRSPPPRAGGRPIEIAPTRAIGQPLRANNFGRLSDGGGYRVEGQPAAGPPSSALAGAPSGQPVVDGLAAPRSYESLLSGVSGQANPFGGQQAALRRAGFQRAFGSQGANMNAALAARGQLNSGIARARLGGLYGAQVAQLQDFDTDEQLRQAEFERQRQQQMMQVLAGQQAQKTQQAQIKAQQAQTGIQQSREKREQEQWQDQQDWGWLRGIGEFAGNVAKILPW